ncbi:hypothetical protein BKA83DRAFT_4036665, partial [Pisolithus microcarpus]
LPKGTPMLQASSTGNWTHPDNVFCTESTMNRLISCNTSPENWGPNTDHLPILMCVNVELTNSPSTTTLNYRAVDWDNFKHKLQSELDTLGPPRALGSEDEFQRLARGLDRALHSTIETEVPRTRPHPHQKQWWNKELTKLRKELKTLSKNSHSFRAIPDHPCH